MAIKDPRRFWIFLENSQFGHFGQFLLKMAYFDFWLFIMTHQISRHNFLYKVDS